MRNSPTGGNYWNKCRITGLVRDMVFKVRGYKPVFLT
jgi:hypothetical protein